MTVKTYKKIIPVILAELEQDYGSIRKVSQTILNLLDDKYTCCKKLIKELRN